MSQNNLTWSHHQEHRDKTNALFFSLDLGGFTGYGLGRQRLSSARVDKLVGDN
jgi:hypothetical protein